MPTRKAAAQELIDRITALRTAGKVNEAEALYEDAEAAVYACAPRDRKAMTVALEVAFNVKPARSAEVAIQSYHDVQGVDAVVTKGVRQVRRAVDAGLKAADMARQVAETLLEARLKMPNQDTGLPDIVAQRKFTKNIAHDLFVEARKGVTEEDVHRWATHQSLAKAVRNRMSDVMVDFLKSLDEDPDRARAIFPTIDFKEGQSATEAVYGAYAAKGVNLPRKGRTELAREDARRRADLVRQAVAGELPAGEAADEEEELARDLAALERVERGFLETTKRAASLAPEARASLKQRINQMIVDLSAAAAQL
ncbi:hypothetical protein [Streptomyces sp. NPDC015414]|uniref:hypothetical protein n=1 Tax=Streptomyces sp. NPDC015414 TaxID=3364957 RepID=UPI00370196EA